MGERTKCLATAAWVTAIDAAVVMYYGNAVWKVLSGIIWSKLLLFLLAAVWTTALLHIWVDVWSRLRQPIEGHRIVASNPANGLSSELAEGIDV
jgi:hypothetical protein